MATIATAVIFPGALSVDGHIRMCLNPPSTIGRLCASALAVLAITLLAPPAARGENDSFIRGYATAVLQRDFEIPAAAVTVEDGVVTVRAELAESERERLSAALEQIAGVERVVVLPVTAEAQPAAAEPSRWSWLPNRQLFRPLIADPRWPRFAAAYNYYIDDSELSSVGNTSFGESFSLLQYDAGGAGALQFGIQAAVFAIFDLTNSSIDLINADYFVALPLAYGIGDFSGLFRIFHQSSHLGDEFLLRNRVQRVNLSYEAIDLLLSYELPLGFRTYGGAGYIFRVEPSDIRPWSLQAGLEYLGDPLDFPLPTRPVAAIDLQIHEEGNWSTNVSPAVGLQFGDDRGDRRNLRLLLQYFNGKSPNGQFYDRHIQYIGLGVQLSL